MSRDIYRMPLFRPNVHHQPRRFGLSIWDFAGPAVLALLLYILACLLFGGF